MKKKIGILGAESTGKSTLAKQLAEHFSGIYIKEYAREYVEALNHPYTERDVEIIARRQIEELSEQYDADYVFFDTELIITKVWFQDKYGTVPEWLEEAMLTLRPDFCLLLMPDLRFVDDPVRENPHRREYLTRLYESELTQYSIPYTCISGYGDKRLQYAIKAIENVACK